MQGYSANKRQDWKDYIAVIATCGLIVLTFLAVFIS